jgi:signal transduction histidine kinase
VRELVSNVLRHAGARRVRVAVRLESGRLVSEVEGDGVGIDGAPEKVGYGRANIRRRLGEVSGVLEIVRGDLGGTRVRVEIPLDET